ncbi:uncharacterized protein LOC130262107 [Oenanthe melanoleuca]|uniref:uncharacterized protein LOC130262107 n=1 Tax=Oenanthe melanoleuca TaxID=2939378 RepID=UPI0024C109A6|nr:uncharacterized protein LOC130262107 [Oenanthe melanoleuca]
MKHCELSPRAPPGACARTALAPLPRSRSSGTRGTVPAPSPRAGTDGPALPRAGGGGWGLHEGTHGSVGLCCASNPCLRSECPVPPSATLSLSSPVPAQSPVSVALVLRASESRRGGRAAPGRARGGSGEQESPAGRRDAAWTSTEVRSASTSFPARSRFPPASRARCGAGTGWHGTAQPGDSPYRSCNHSEGQGGQGQGALLELPAPARMEPTKIPLTKRAAPAPPVPAKTKPAPVLATKPSEPQPSASADTEQGRASDPDANGFNMVAVTTARLSHPTATRPRIPGQRPPSIVLGSTGGPLGGEQPQGLPRAALCAPVPSTGQVPVPPWSSEGLEVLEGRSLALEDLKAEVRTLHILVDLMRVQHLRDLQDLRQELCQERTQRQALQAEIERVRKVLPC